MATTPTLCIVDDDTDYRYLIGFLFEKYLPTCSTRFFTSGHSFLEQLPTFQVLPCVIFLDYHMPRLDGLTILVYLKEQPAYKNIPVVMMSAIANDLEINNFYNSGAASFINKGADFNSVINLVTNLCANSF